ncbi:MAG: 3-deoxy-7-phosphoheptulonate synthase [Acidimicrobiia bacterium]
MLIVMKRESTEDDVQTVLHKIRETGNAEGFISRGEFHTVIGVVGDVETLAQQPLLALPGVEKIQRVSRPFKLVSHEGHPGTSTIPVDGTTIGPDTFTIIAGACAIEDEEQAFEASRAAKEAGAKILRGDAYKPRTSPYSFQGLAEKGLKIMEAIRSDLQLPVMAEVLDSRDIDKVAAVADILRIGTRNMQNFTLLKEVSLTSKPVLLKRGMTNTIEEWLMAAEHIARHGNSRIILCERGIRTFEPSTRNTLDISAIPIVREESHLPVIVDPSHASGKKSLVAPLARAATVVGADGVMLDVHPHPELALCDGPQALLPGELLELSEELKKLAKGMGRTV